MQHTKSPCCHAPIRRYGERRQQCTACFKTWRVHKHKRGRKPTRIQTPFIQSLFETNSTVRQLILHHSRLEPSRVLYRLRRQLRQLAEQPPQYPLPPGPLVLLVDGFWFRFLRHDWVLYLCAVKPLLRDTAWILEPMVIEGKERYSAWQRAIKSLPLSICNHIKAFVSDGFRGSARIARKYGWVHQRCHFHLLAQLYSRAGHRKKKLSQRARRKRIVRLIRRCLEEPNHRSVAQLVYRLRCELKNPFCPIRYRQIGRDFLRNLESFRAYLMHPHLRLPATTSSIESYGKELRKYTRCLNTHKALSLWSKMYVRYHPTVVCNGKYINQI